jgi:hypothetical protein
MDSAMRDFATRAIRSDPLAYLRISARDFVLPFWAPTRVNHYEYATAVKWTFADYIDYQPTPLWTAPAFAQHGGEAPVSRQPVADVLAHYGDWVYVPGPVTLLILLLAVAGAVVRREETRPLRPLIVLLVVLPVGLSLVPDLTAEFVWRYELPTTTLLPMAAALAWVRLRAPRGQRGTTATPSTD